jgi:YidC/Oxa1 family membrane protein insertase
MEKRAILAIALSVLVFIVFQYVQQTRRGQKIPARPATPIESQVQEPVKQLPPAPVEAAPVKAAPVPVSVSTEDTRASSQTVVVEGDIYRAVLDNRGAVLTSWELRDYKSGQNQAFEMIAGNREGEKRAYPGSMIFKDPALTDTADDEFYQVSIEDELGKGVPLAPPVSVVFKLKRGDLAIEKRYHFEKDNYLVDLSSTCKMGDKALDGQFFLGQDIGPEQEHLLSSSKLEAVYFSAGKVRRQSPPKDENEIKKIEGDVRWVGLDMHYFALIVIPDRPFSYFDIQKHPVKAVSLDGKQVDRDLLRITTPMDGSLKYQIYLGPKKQSNLEAVRAADIKGVIKYGMFSILVHPLLASLRWIHGYVHNYGYAIIILTILISILLFPFRLKQMISMKKMQVVQPKVKAIQEKYRRYKKTDPKRAEMNQEIMALYKEHNVNPLGGCLPLILQMPLLFAFYSLLMNSIELRQAPFILWIHDLSVKDPYYVLPIIMGVTMFISQKMTPMTPGADPTQTKMMMFMPVVFTIMFFNVMSGLNLYFLCSNIFQVGFQKIAERWMSDGKSGKPSKS